MTTLLTRWASEAMCDKPLQKHPKPQFKRDSWLNLNGMFEYAIENENVTWCENYQGEIRVPFAVESCLSGVCKRVNEKERIWYKKSFEVPEEYKDKKVILHFEAVDWETTVYINKKQVGTHIGGYCPFSFDISDYLVDGENELVVKVFDPTDKGWQNRGKQSSKSFGIWYTSTSGIWQTVWLEFVNTDHIKNYKLTPNIDTQELEIITDVIGDGELKLEIFDGDEVHTSKTISKNEKIKIHDMKLWSPESPFLYTFKLSLISGEKAVDEVEGYFGMRKFSIGEFQGYNRLFLNNEPYFQRGLLDQGYWSDGGMTAPTDEALIYDIATMKNLGFNMMRKHIKVESARWYYHCDRLGMIVWQDMVSGGKSLDAFHAGVLPTMQSALYSVVKLSKKDNAYKTFHRDRIEWRTQFEEELDEMMDTLHNYPCIGCWVPFNEGWGQFDAKRIAQKMKDKDPTRVVDHASGWYDQKGADLNSLHIYVRPVKAPKYDGRPFVLSEYGGYSHKIEGHVWNWSKSFGYQMYNSKETLTAAYEKLHNNQIAPAIKKGLSASIYTQVSDVEFEVNGILSYDREFVKLDENMIVGVNQKLVYDKD